MEQSSLSRSAGSAQGSGVSDNAPSQFSSESNTSRSSAPQANVPQAAYSLNAAGPIPGTRPAKLILRPFEYSSSNSQGGLYGDSPQPEYMRFYNIDEDVPVKKQTMLFNMQSEGPMNKTFASYGLEDGYASKPQLYPPNKSASGQQTLQGSPSERPPVPYAFPFPLQENKLPKEQAFLKSWNEVDHAGSGATCRLEQVPLPLLERIPGDSPKFKLRGPLVRVQMPQMPAVTGDFRRFCQRVAAAFSGAASDCNRLFKSPCGNLQLPPMPKLECCSPQTPIQQECKACGFKGHFCPECGTGQGDATGMVFHGTPPPRIPASRGVLIPQEGCLERCMRWHWSLFEDVGEAIDQEILCDRTNGLFREFGEFVDNLVAEGIHAVSFSCAGLCSAIPSRSRTIVEGYPLYEPDPKLIRKERPTSATGNACVDQLNAFLDACLTEPSQVAPELLPPPVPDTQKTGSWIIDAANAALDYCLQERSPPPPPPAPRKKICPVEMLIPPCCRERPPPVEVPPPKQPMCNLLGSCMPRDPNCPHCHQPIRKAGGKCPKEESGSCRIQLCPSPEPEVTAVVPQGPSLVYPYKEEDFQARDRSGLVEALDDHSQGVALPQRMTVVKPVGQY
ncbi:hypothetical protein Efla_004881 [Eimeria flavescens]